MKKRAVVLILVVISLLYCVATAGDTLQFAQVATKKGPLNMRQTASRKADIIEKIPKDTILLITPIDTVWCKCTYNHREGYVMTEYLTLMDLSQFRTLSLNDSGQDVLTLQEKLRDLYFIDPDTAASGTFDSGTEAAVQLFQSANGMAVTGVASPEDQAFLYWGDAKNNLPTKPMKVTIACSCSGYNHVGNSWSKYFSLNGESISSGDIVEIVLGESITLYAKITESDSSPDIGSETETIEISQEYYDHGFTITHKVTVKENKGRYSGNKAHWTVTYTFEP